MKVKLKPLAAACGLALAAVFGAAAAHAAANEVLIGDIDDMSGLYADVIGPGGVVAAGPPDHTSPIASWARAAHRSKRSVRPSQVWVSLRIISRRQPFVLQTSTVCLRRPPSAAWCPAMLAGQRP